MFLDLIDNRRCTSMRSRSSLRTRSVSPGHRWRPVRTWSVSGFRRQPGQPADVSAVRPAVRDEALRGDPRGRASVKLHICGDIRNSIRFMLRRGVASSMSIGWFRWMRRERRSRRLLVSRASRPRIAGWKPATRRPVQTSPWPATSTPRRSCSRDTSGSGRRRPPEHRNRRPAVHSPARLRGPPGTPEQNIRAFCPCQGCLIPSNSQDGGPVREIAIEVRGTASPSRLRGLAGPRGPRRAGLTSPPL